MRDRVDAASSASFPASDPPSWTLGNNASKSPSEPEVWLRGPLPDVNPYLMHVAHSLIQAREDLAGILPDLSPEELWERPGGAASIGFHLRHIPGTIDRLLTYARGEMLSAEQLGALKREGERSDDGPAHLLKAITEAVDRAMEQIRTTPSDTLTERRDVGRKRLPSTVIGLISHAAEHTHRHTGQVITTAKILRGLHDGQPGA